MRTRIVAVLALLGGAAAGMAAEPRPLTPKDLDERAWQAASDTTAAGTDLFNAGDKAGCYRLYQGSLMTLTALLDHRPKLAAAVREKLAAAAKMAPPAGAFALREALDAVRAETAGKPLWDRLGGEKAVRAVVREFLTTAAKDPKVNVDRNGNYPLTKERAGRVEQLLVEMVSSVTGGPLKYTGRDMKNSHAGMKITDAEFDAAAGHLVAALKKFEVPQAEIDELVKIVGTTRADMVEKK